MSEFRFKRFSVKQEKSALKVGTDAVLLGASMTLPERDGEMLDIGTGTGVIALMAAQRMYDRAEACQGCRTWHITAIDIDRPSIEEAADNFRNSPWSNHLDAVCLSLAQYSGYVGENSLFSAIFTNPPFYDDSLRNPDCRKSAARHTDSLPREEILSFAARHLERPSEDDMGGILSMILPAEDETALLRSAASFGLFPFRIIRIRTVPSKKPRRIIAEFRLRPKRKGTADDGVSLQEITLQDGGNRSEEYEKLTEGFYL